MEGRGKKYAVIGLVLLLQLSFCAEAGLGENLKNAQRSLGIVGMIADAIGELFSTILGIGVDIAHAGLLLQFHTTMNYDSAISPENTANSYFHGLEARESKTYTINAWSSINTAKKKFAEARAACTSLNPSCPELFAEMIEALAKGNAEAMNAGSAALAETLDSLDELEHLGGDMPEYGGKPFQVYADFTTEYEKTNGAYSKFRKAMAGYGFIDTNWFYYLECEPNQKSSWIENSILDKLTCLKLKPSKLSSAYLTPYNLLIGASDTKSGIRQILKANTMLKEAIRVMQIEHDLVNEEANNNIKLLENKIKTLENAKNIDYTSYEKLMGKLPQKPGTLLVKAKEDMESARITAKLAERIFALKQDNYLAKSTIKLRQASSEANYATSLVNRAETILENMLFSLDNECKKESEETMSRASAIGLYSSLAVEKQIEKCEEAKSKEPSKAIPLYIEAILSLRFLKSSTTEKTENVWKEIETLELMIAKAENDFSVEQEKQLLQKAKQYAENTLPVQTRNETIAKAYEAAIEGQKSIWAKAQKLFAGLDRERLNVLHIMEILEDVNSREKLDGFRELQSRLTKMEGKYSGAITIESLGSLAKARSLYNEIKDYAGTKLSPEKMLVVTIQKKALAPAECDTTLPVHYNITAWNPFDFEIGETSIEGRLLGPFAPREEIQATTVRYEKLVACNKTFERITLLRPERDERRASRQVTVYAGVEQMRVFLEAKDVIEVLGSGEIVPGGIEVLSKAKNTTVETRYYAKPSMRVHGPACESDGTTEVCRYVLTLECANKQNVDIILPRPLSLEDTVTASNGNAENGGAFGIIITQAKCPGHSTVDVRYKDLTLASEDMLSKISHAISQLDDGIAKDDFENEYEKLKQKTDKEVISEGASLLGRIEEELTRQVMIDDNSERAWQSRKELLEKWLSERGFELPWLPTNDEDAMTILEKTREEARQDLAQRYNNAAEHVIECNEMNKLLKKFGFESPTAEKLRQEFSSLNSGDDYLSFAKNEKKISELYEKTIREINSLAEKISVEELGETSVIEDAERACDTQVEIEEPIFLLEESYAKNVAEEINNVINSITQAKKLADGTVDAMKALDSQGLYPNELEKQYKNIVKEVEKTLADARAKTEKEILRAEGYYAELAEQSLEQGYVNRAYAYAKHAQAKKTSLTGLLSMDNSLLFLAPLIIAVLIWQLRKKQKKETPIRKAMRII